MRQDATPVTIDTFYTDAEGFLIAPERLVVGSGYSLVEDQAEFYQIEPGKAPSDRVEVFVIPRQ